MKKIFSALLLFTCLGMFLASPAHAANKKSSPTLSTLKKEVDKLQKEMEALIQGQSVIEARIRALEQQQAKQAAKPNTLPATATPPYSYP